jgi:hypothetical protein
MQFPSLVTDIGADGTVLVPFVTLEVATPCSTPYIGANSPGQATVIRIR